MSRRNYDVLKGTDWPDYDIFLNLALEEILPESIRNEILNFINVEPKYHKSLFPLLKHQFVGAEEIAEHYSHSWQDLFVLTMLDGKRNGTYLEIGANDPIHINNTYLLEQFGYSGISIDINQDLNWASKRLKSKYIVADATAINYNELLKDMPKQIDYLQIDIDPEQATLEALQKLPHDKYRFSVITYETDAYKGNLTIRDASRELFKSLGYKMIVKNVGTKEDKSWSYGPWVSYEDWYVDPNVINQSISDRFETLKDINLPHEIFF